MKVLVLVDSLSLGGAERLLATLARAGRATGLEVEVASLAGTADDRAVMAPALLAEGVQPRFLGIRRLADPRALPRIAAAVRASRCDVVHAHLEYAATLAPHAARLAGRHAVCTFHHVPGELRGREAVKERLAVAVANTSRGVIFVSHASMAGFAARYRRDPTRWVVVPNGVDLDAFAPGPATFPAELGIPPAAPVVAMVAALRPGKGHATVVAAWPAVRDRVPGARLLLVGAGPQEQPLRRQAAAAGVADAVVFAGTRDDVPRLLRASALVTLPSADEALPTALIEAAACAKAVVATPAGGIPEVVDHGSNGLLVPVGDARALAGALVRLLLDPGRAAAMGLAARAAARDRFGMYRWAGRLRRVYQAAADGMPAAVALGGPDRHGGPWLAGAGRATLSADDHPRRRGSRR